MNFSGKNTMEKQKTSIAKSIAEIAVVVALMVVFTLFVSIPFVPVPLTFQTVICICSGILLGRKKGAIAMFVYFFLGFVCHIPVFAGFTGGFVTVFKPTFGYIIGFIPAAYVAGLIVDKSPTNSFGIYILAAVCGVLVNYIIGIPYFMTIWKFYLGKGELWQAFLTYNLIYIPKDIVLGVIAAFVCKPVKKATNL